MNGGQSVFEKSLWRFGRPILRYIALQFWERSTTTHPKSCLVSRKVEHPARHKHFSNTLQGDEASKTLFYSPFLPALLFVYGLFSSKAPFSSVW
jgi:hypothetical protein